VPDPASLILPGILLALALAGLALWLRQPWLLVAAAVTSVPFSWAYLMRWPQPAIQLLGAGLPVALVAGAYVVHRRRRQASPPHEGRS